MANATNKQVDYLNRLLSVCRKQNSYPTQQYNAEVKGICEAIAAKGGAGKLSVGEASAIIGRLRQIYDPRKMY